MYVLEGSGSLCLKGKAIDFSKGDLLMIDGGEEYYWDTKYCKITIICTPPWNSDQYELLD